MPTLVYVIATNGKLLKQQRADGSAELQMPKLVCVAASFDPA